MGYPLDIVVCSALGADMYDCVYPTRTARFGTALVPEVGITYLVLLFIEILAVIICFAYEVIVIHLRYIWRLVI